MAEKRKFLEPRGDLSLCRQTNILGMARSSAYYVSEESLENIQIMHHLDAIYTELPFFGSRRMKNELLDQYQLIVNRKRIQRLMQVMGIEAIYPKKNTSIPDHLHRTYPYLFCHTSLSYCS